METTPSMRKASSAYKTKQEGTKTERHALIDITNDSPITGLANGSFSQSPIKDLTPGSGEALLRGQVKNLLKEVEFKSKIPSFSRNLIPPSKLGFARSPMQLLAPTPNNTPQIGVSPFSDDGFLQPPPQILSPVVPLSESLSTCQINRALLFDDSPDKQDASSSVPSKTLDVSSLHSSSLPFNEALDASSLKNSSLPFHEALEISSTHSSSSLTYEESIGSVKSRFVSPNSDNSSDWSMKANAGTEGENEELVSELDELCEGIKKINVFEGKHVRFVYNSDGEIEGEEVECFEKHVEVVVREGKHLRFQEEEDEED